MSARARRVSLAAAIVGVAFAASGCNEGAIPPAGDAGAPVAGLTSEQANRVVAKVGSRVITLGDYAKALERMDPYDRLRFQSKERRRELLNEMIDVELLAAEARRRGLDKEPETEEAVDQILRDAILQDARKHVGAPMDIPPADIRAYYDAHPDRFTEPEHRRVAAIVLDNKKDAEETLKDAIGAKTQAEWGELFAKHSITAPKTKDPAPVELVGDLGIVGPPDDVHGGSPRVPEPVRAAAFQIHAPNEVLDHVVEAEGRFFVVRLSGLTAARKKSFQESDKQIRVILLQERMGAADKALEDELKKKIPVQIDEAALATVKVSMPTKEQVAAPPMPSAPEPTSADRTNAPPAPPKPAAAP